MFATTSKQTAVTKITSPIPVGGGSQVWFWKGYAAGNLKVRSIHIPLFKKKWPVHITISSIFDQNYVLSKIFFNLSQFWFKFGKIDPFIYQILHFIRGHWYTRRLILLPMFPAVPWGLLYWVPPFPSWQIWGGLPKVNGCKQVFKGGFPLKI